MARTYSETPSRAEQALLGGAAFTGSDGRSARVEINGLVGRASERTELEIACVDRRTGRLGLGLLLGLVAGAALTVQTQLRGWRLSAPR